MKRNYLLLAMCFVLQACFGGGGGGGGSEGQSDSSGPRLSGVAATGAAISNGAVEVTDADENVFRAKTGNDGRYSVSVANGRGPYLVVVTPLVGSPVTSLATDEDVVSARKVNVTPLTHVIVANTLGTTNLSHLKVNFKTSATDEEQLKTKLEEKKEQLQTALSSLMQHFGIAGQDLINGNIVAGSSQGLDRLLDAIEVKPGAGDVSTIAFRGGREIVSVDPETEEIEEVVIKPEEIEAVENQLGALDGIKQLFLKAEATLSKYHSCNGEPQNSGTCSLDNLHAEFSKLMHPQYKYAGLNRSQDAWSWFCEGEEDEPTSKEECIEVDIDRETFSDFNIVEINQAGDTAFVTYNTYEDGKVVWFEGEFVKKEGNEWKFLGNQLSFDASIEARISRTTEILDGEIQSDDFTNALQLWSRIKSEEAAKISEVTLTTADDSEFTPITLGFAPSYTSQNGQEYVRLIFPCDSCEEWEQDRFTLSEEVISGMKDLQKMKISFKYEGELQEEFFFMVKPIILNEEKADRYLGQISNLESVCSAVPELVTFTAPEGVDLQWVNYHSSVYTSNSTISISVDEDIESRGIKQLVMRPVAEEYPHSSGEPDEEPNYVEIDLPVGQKPNYSGIYIGTMDVIGRQFVNEIRCNHSYIPPQTEE